MAALRERVCNLARSLVLLLGVDLQKKTQLSRLRVSQALSAKGSRRRGWALPSNQFPEVHTRVLYLTCVLLRSSSTRPAEKGLSTKIRKICMDLSSRCITHVGRQKQPCLRQGCRYPARRVGIESGATGLVSRKSQASPRFGRLKADESWQRHQP